MCKYEMYVWERESEGVERNNGGLLTWSYRLQKSMSFDTHFFPTSSSC